MLKFILPKFHFTVEHWKWNSEYKLYASNMGNFMDKYKCPIPIKIDTGGYVRIKTEYGYLLAHRLVMFTWRPTANMENLTVDHLNHNKRDNSFTNLEWVTKEENEKRAIQDQIHVVEYAKGRIKGAGQIFSNIDEAALFLTTIDKNLTIDNTKRKITNSIYCGSKFFGCKWEFL